MAVLIAPRPLDISTRRRNLITLPVALDPQAAVLTLSIPRPTSTQARAWNKTGQVRVTLVVDIDGVEHRCSGTVHGGVRTAKDGSEADAYTLTWHLPWGFFEDEPEGTLARRWGESAKSQYRAWVELERIAGAAVTEFQVDCLAAPAPNIQRHHSIAFDTGTAVAENGGDGDLSTSFTAGAGSNRIVCVAFASDATSGHGLPHTVTFNGAAPSAHSETCVDVNDGSFSHQTVRCFMESEIGSGAKTVAGSTSDTDGGTTLAIVSYSGVDQTTPHGTRQQAAATSGSSSTLTVTSVGSTDVVVDFLYVWDTAVTIGADQTQRAGTEAGSNLCRISDQPGSAGGAMSWSGLGGEWCHGAFALKEAAGGGGSPKGNPLRSKALYSLTSGRVVA